MQWTTCLLYFVYAVLSVITVSYLIIKKRFSYWKDRGIPYEEPEFPLGCLKGAGSQWHLKDILAKIYDKYKNKFEFVGAYFYINPVVIVTNVEFARNIFIKDFQYFQARGVYNNERDDPITAHLLSLEGQKWKNLRAKLTPTFTSGKMKFMYPTMIEVAERFDQTLREILETEEIIEIKDLIARYTTDVIGTCAFGIECNSLKDPNCEFRKLGRKIFTGTKFSVIERLFKNLYPNLARSLRMRVLSPKLANFFMGVVRDTIEYREKNNVRRNDFMDLLIELKNGKNIKDADDEQLGTLTIEEIAAQSFLFFVAGFETSATTISWTLYELSLNLDIQNRARKEINEVLKRHNGEFNYESMMEMTYIDQIISETLRKHPAAPSLQRKCVKDYPVGNTGKIIEKGTIVITPVFSIHHDPDIYPEPETYNPDRFHPEEVKKRSSTTFLGFGDGPRNCIGMRFGRMQSKVGLVTLLKNYRFKVCDKTPIPMKYSPRNPILSCDGGLYLSIEKV